jgi:CRP/FNR family transcriptional regulator
VLQVLSQKPEALLALTRQLADRVVEARDDAAKLIFDDCRQRLVRSLIHFSRSAASTPHESGVVLHLTHGQLAQAIGVARETVSLTLTQLKQQNLLRTGRNRLYFDPETLSRVESSNEIETVVEEEAVETAA